MDLVIVAKLERRFRENAESSGDTRTEAPVKRLR